MRCYSRDFKSVRMTGLLVDEFALETMEKSLSDLLNSFDVAKAKNDNNFVVNPGVEKDYDACLAKIRGLEKEFSEHLADQKRELGCPELKYKDLGKEIYQIEVPARYLPKVPRDWLKRSSTKTVSRYHSPELVHLVRRYQEALETKTSILDSLYARTLVRFDSFYTTCWRPAIDILSEIDCLMSLARVSGHSGPLGDIKCRPVFVESEPEQVGFVDMKECRHACMMNNATRDFIPNDIR